MWAPMAAKAAFWDGMESRMKEIPVCVPLDFWLREDAGGGGSDGESDEELGRGDAFSRKPQKTDICNSTLQASKRSKK